MSTKVSVVIPTHNRLAGLQDSLASLLGQTVLPDEVTVVDDGSKEPVPDTIFKSFPAQIIVKLLRNEKPMGGNNARNRGVLASTADYIAFLDDDDAFKPNKIEEVKKVIYDNQKADIIYHPAHIHMVNEGVSYYSKPKAFKEGDDIFRQLLVKNAIGGTPMVTIKRQSLIDVGLFDENMPALQDYELWLRMAQAGAKFYYLNKPLTDYNYISKKNSVSKGIETNDKAINLIERKYASDYALMTTHEKRHHEAWKKHMKVHKSLLNGQRFQALRYQIGLFIKQPKASNMLLMVLVLLGPTVVFKLKAKISK